MKDIINRFKIINLFVIIDSLCLPAIHQHIYAQVSLQDSLFLIALYDSTDGANWTNNTNWLTEEPLSTWYGIGVTNDRVASIELGNNNLNGTIPPSIGDLDSLDYLNLYGNQLVDSIPAVIGSLTQLTTLDLSLNQLRGSIPIELSNLINLIDLNLRFNNLTGSIPIQIGNLSNLKSLNLSGNSLTGTIPSAIGDLSNLTDMDLSTNLLSGSIPPEIESLTHLENLDLGINNLSGTIPLVITNLIKLTGLTLRNNNLTGSIPSEIGNLTDLMYLSLDNNQFSGAIPGEISHLKNLVYLALNNNQLNDGIPADIDSLIHLTILRLEGNEFSGSVPIQITHLTPLEILNINDNQLEDLPALDSLTLLNELRIQNNRFTFEDIEPNVGIPSGVFTYSPQDSVGFGADTTLNAGENLSFSAIVGGNANQYQWMKNGTDIVGATDSVYTIELFDSSDIGAYMCRISNTIATDLIIYSRVIHVAGTSTTGLADNSAKIPELFVLHHNYPNPFNPRTVISWQVGATSTSPVYIELSVYNLLGQKVATLVSGKQNAGVHSIEWDARNLSSGVYYYMIKVEDPAGRTGEWQDVKKMVVIK